MSKTLHRKTHGVERDMMILIRETLAELVGWWFEIFTYIHKYLSNVKNLGWLGYIGDYTTELYRAL